MHYKNGREARNGDKVVLFPSYGAPVIGILYDAVPGNNYCNGRLAPCAPSDSIANLAECIHYEDVTAAVKDAEDRRTAAAEAAAADVDEALSEEAAPDVDGE